MPESTVTSSTVAKCLLALAVIAIASSSIGAADDQRPPGLNGATWQFGPLNRWAYTHMSEVIPSK